MLDADRWQEIWASLAKNPGRTALTAFGVFWGIFLLMLLLGSGNGLSNGVQEGFSGSATNSFFLWTRRTSEPYHGLPPGRGIEISNADVEALVERVPEAAVIAPRNQLGGHRSGNTVSRGRETAAFSVMGDYPAIRRIQGLTIDQGRFLNDLDIRDRRKVAVIGTRVYELLFDDGEPPIGDSIEINGVYFQVVGVFGSLQSQEQAERDAETVFIPFTTFQNAFNYGDRVNWLAVTAQPGVPASQVEESVRAVLAERLRVAPSDERAFGSFNVEEEYNRVQGLFAGIRLLVWIVGVGTLAAGVIGVSNIMLILVRERTREIGLRRAIGAGPASITGQVVLEAVALTGVAGYLGLVAGVGLVELVRFGLVQSGAGGGMFQDPGVSFANALEALAILVGSGVLAGLIPAQRAVAVRPVEALRHE